MELLHTESRIGIVKNLGRRRWRDRIGDFARSSSVVVVAGRIGPLRPCGEDCVSVSGYSKGRSTVFQGAVSLYLDCTMKGSFATCEVEKASPSPFLEGGGSKCGETWFQQAATSGLII